MASFEQDGYKSDHGRASAAGGAAGAGGGGPSGPSGSGVSGNGSGFFGNGGGRPPSPPPPPPSGSGSSGGGGDDRGRPRDEGKGPRSRSPSPTFWEKTGKVFFIPKSRISHIFRDSEGHLSNTPENRQMLQKIANDPSTTLGQDNFGNTWSAKLTSDGTQFWVQTRGDEIVNGGLNRTPRSYNTLTGLSNINPSRDLDPDSIQ